MGVGKNIQFSGGIYTPAASPHLQTLITSVQRYGINFRHISGKLPTDLINVADFSSGESINHYLVLTGSVKLRVQQRESGGTGPDPFLRQYWIEPPHS